MSQIIYCTTTQQCPFLFYCSTDTICTHNPIWPLTSYSAFIYLLIPVFLALANIGGVSGGYLKVPLFMDLLNYTQTQATYYTYPIILGGGMANFFLLVPQRHPYQQKSLVDYNIVNVLLPCVIFGSTIGVICNLLIPEIVLDILVMLVFGFIAILFGQKYRDYIVDKRIKSGELSKLLSQKPKYFKRSKSWSSKSDKKYQQFELTKIQQVQQSQSQIFYAQNFQLQQIKKQDKGINYRQIIKSVFIFTFFQVLSLLIQGKIIKFKVCNAVFGLLFFLFLIIFVAYLVIYYYYQKPTYQYYQKIQYKYQINLSDKFKYLLLSCGGVLAGFSTGLIAAGCGHILILTMLSLNVNQKVASATSGYQVMFIGASATIQAYIQGSLALAPLLIFLLLSLIGSFALSIFAYRLFDKMQDKGEGKIIIILILLSLISLIGVVPSIIITQKYYGWTYLLSIKGFSC